MDRISSLPDEIICHIGSFLSAKEAAFAMVLSRRWKNLFTIVPELHFRCNDGESFTEFTDRVLPLPVNSRIRKFSLIWEFEETEHAHINRFLCHVLKHGVLVLKLEIFTMEEDVYSLPLEVFTCETLAELTLGYEFSIDFLPGDAYLPALKTLSLNSIRFYEFGPCAFSTLLSASPKLEGLVLYDIDWLPRKWSFTVSSPTLRSLAIARGVNYHGYEFESFSLDTPGLMYLYYSECIPKEYSFVNINSLIEANLDLYSEVEDGSVWEEGYANYCNPMNMINSLRNVEILDLTVQTMEMIYVFRKVIPVIPVFENLFRLSLGFSNNFWVSLPILLKKSPNLKTLIINDSLYDSDSEEEHVCQGVLSFDSEEGSVCHGVLSCPVEVLKITEYRGNIGELEQIKHFLKKLSCLKLVKVRAYVKDEEKDRVLADLLMLPRTLSDCKIQVKFS